jgi:agmatinase
MREHGTWMQWGPGLEKTLLRRVDNRPVYVTLDLDVLDPACLAATGNPEAGGWFYQDLERFYHVLCRMRVVGADVVELNPGLDPSEVATIAAAKIVRELLLILAMNG